MDDARHQLLEAALRVYAGAGYRGATTRRIAQEAGVSEITLFRHFGSKDALIREALRCAEQDPGAARLPDSPVDPERELTEWCQACAAELYRVRSVIRTVMGEIEEHPEIIQHASSCPTNTAAQLRAYLERLRAQDRMRGDVDSGVASAMLMGALFAAAMGSDMMPEIYGRDLERTVAEYVSLFLRAIGIARPAIRVDRSLTSSGDPGPRS